MPLEAGQKVRIPGSEDFETVDTVVESPTGLVLFVKNDAGAMRKIQLTADQASAVEVLARDGKADPNRVLAGLWTEWMKAATVDSRATALASTPLRPYAHQSNAVYGVMLPQAKLRFLLADEPGTGKTIMAGLYIREMQRLGLITRALIVVPAHLVSKWQDDFDRFFGGGLLKIESDTARQGSLRPDQDLWVVSLDLAATNRSIQELIRPDKAGWDLVVIDEAHRLTPTAQYYHQVGELLCRHTPRVLLMTATPHRGKEWLFRALMHHVDPEVFPPAEMDVSSSQQLKPGRLHFLRRMKEDMVDYDGVTKLFKGRHARNEAVALNSTEAAFYGDALALVNQFFPPNAVPLAAMVYGKRAASSLYALSRTLHRRHELMGSALPATAAMEHDIDEVDPSGQDEARVIVEQSLSAKAEKKAIEGLLEQLDALLADPALPVSKWPRMEAKCLRKNGILPGNAEQVVVFTEYADTADWLSKRFKDAGYSAARYSGRDSHHDRDKVRADFAASKFQVLVSTDAGNEGIDLQSAHVLVNWDIPWSLVRLEQRMGRIHRVGQTRDVQLYNLIASDAREGEVLEVLLNNFVTAANRLDGKMFDSLSLVGEMVGLDLEKLLSETYRDPERRAAAMAIAKNMTASSIESASKKAAAEENALKTSVDVAAAVTDLHRESLERINPKIVEAFLTQLSSTGIYAVSPHGSGSGLFVLRTNHGGLPRQLSAGSQVVVATSGTAVEAARKAGATLSGVISLGPSEPAFRALVAAAGDHLKSSLFRGARLIDPTSVTGYDLFCYEVEIVESGGRRRVLWPFLIRSDPTGCRSLRWEMLGNLEVGSFPGSGFHPARAAEAEVHAQLAVQQEATRRRTAWMDWLTTAEHDLEKLPVIVSSTITDPEERRKVRRQMETAVAKRLGELRQLGDVSVGEARLAGWAHVDGAGVPAEPTQADSEEIAMGKTADMLRGQGWAVSDVHTESRGYDLYAVRGRAQLCVEVKGVWELATSSGITMTGNELLIARQHGSEYWLYVVDQCNDGRGRLYEAYPDPARLFAGLTKDIALIKVPGSALKAAKEALASA